MANDFQCGNRLPRPKNPSYILLEGERGQAAAAAAEVGGSVYMPKAPLLENG
jgi:hypothetical protein